jgi:AraC-like DNA-binding protein
MKSTFVMDLTPDSYSLTVTPDALAMALPFRLESAGMFDCGSAYYTEREGLNNHLLIYTLAGRGEVDVGEGRELLEPGCAVVIDCMKRHYYGAVPGRRWRFYYAHFQGHMEAFMPLLSQGIASIRPSDEKAFEKNMADLLEAVRSGDPTCCLVCNDLMTRLLTQLMLAGYGGHRDVRLRRHLPALHALQLFLREHYAQEITLDEMAERMHMSKFHFVRLFRAYARVTPYAYLTDLRINAACERLMLSNLSVREIADEVGLFDSNRLIRLFKERCGLTPAQYRALWR